MGCKSFAIGWSVALNKVEKIWFRYEITMCQCTVVELPLDLKNGYVLPVGKGNLFYSRHLI